MWDFMLYFARTNERLFVNFLLDYNIKNRTKNVLCPGITMVAQPNMLSQPLADVVAVAVLVAA